MAILDSQKLDYLWKKVGYAFTKTDTPINKLAPNESIASPMSVRVDKIMRESTSIPNIIPTASAGVVTVYPASAPVECISDLTASTNRTWKTNLTDWISPEFGSTYQIKVFIHTTNSGATAATSGTQVFATGSGFDDEWFFDHQSGVLNFIGVNLPNGVNFNNKSVYVVGARYTGIFGIGSTFGNISLNGETIQSTGNIVLSVNGTISAAENTITNVADPIDMQDAVTLGFLVQYTASQLSDVSGMLISDDTSLLVIDDGIEPGRIDITADGDLVSSITQSTTSLYNQVDIASGVSINSNQTNNNFVVNGTNNALLIVAHSSSNTVTIGGNNPMPTLGAALTINSTDSILLPKGSTGDRPGNSGKIDVAGMIRFNSTLGTVEFFDGSEWKSTSTEFTIMSGIRFAGQSDSGNVDGVNTVFVLPHPTTTPSTIVSINGIVQIPVMSYEVDGSSLIFTEPPVLGDIIDVRVLTTAVTVSLVASPNGVSLVEAKNAGVSLITGTTNPTERVLIDNSGIMQVVNNTKIAYNQAPVVVSTSSVVIDSFDNTVYRSAKYLVEVSNISTGEYEVIDALVIHNGTAAFINILNSVFTGTASLGTVETTVNGSKIELLYTGENSNNNVKVFATYIKI